MTTSPVINPTPKQSIGSLVRLTGITKRFGSVTVLQDVQFEVAAGEVHVLAGENGAGKSTLIKILAGIHTDFEGLIEYAGRTARPRTPLEANALGVAVIHQELSLIGAMSVADNIFLGRTPTRGGFVCDARQHEESLHWVRQLGLDIDVRQPVEQFPIAVQQLIEIAKALSQNAKVIVMDEPTSALNAPEVEKLFALIQSLTQRGCGIVYISHKMEEIARIADRITVLRDGKWIGTASAKELPPQKFIQWMVGRDLGEQFPRRAPHPGAERLRLENVSVFPEGFSGAVAAQNISLEVRAGEILGIGGLQGAGASELLLGLFGAYGNSIQGKVLLDGQEIHFARPRAAIESGLVLLTNDRKATGLVLSLSIIANATLAGLRELSRGGWRNPDAERRAAENMTRQMKLRAASLELEVGALSGGNQQKVAIAKWLQTKPKVLLLDEPTRGIDVAAKREIYQLMDEWTAQGMAIVLITSEMPELLTLSDRIVVMHRGKLTATFTREKATPEAILAAAMGDAAESDFKFINMTEELKNKTPNLLKRLVTSPGGRAFMALLLVLLVGMIFNADGAFFKIGTHRDALRQASVYGILACGLTLVIISGGIDLAVGSVLALAAVCGSTMAIHWGWSGWLVVPACLLVGGACGGLSGFVTARLRVQPFIATLALMVFARGAAKYASGGMKVSTAVKNAAGNYDYVAVPALFRDVDTRILGGNLSMVTVIFLVCVVLAWLVLAKHSWGRNLYAIGGNEEAARLSGVPVVWAKAGAYVASGVFAAVAGICQAAQEQQGDPEAGGGYELIAIAMVVIGGTSLMGGRGGMGLTLLGVLTIGYLDKILSINAVPEAGRLMLTGAIIVAAVLTQRRKRT